MELETYYLEELKEIRITEPSKEHHDERAVPPPWKRIWVSKKGGKTTVVAISHTDHHSESRAKIKCCCFSWREMSKFVRATEIKIPNLGNPNRASIPLASKSEPYMQGEHFERHWQSTETGKLIRNTSNVQTYWSKILVSTTYSKRISN